MQLIESRHMEIKLMWQLLLGYKVMHKYGKLYFFWTYQSR